MTILNYSGRGNNNSSWDGQQRGGGRGRGGRGGGGRGGGYHRYPSAAAYYYGGGGRGRGGWGGGGGGWGYTGRGRGRGRVMISSKWVRPKEALPNESGSEPGPGTIEGIVDPDDAVDTSAVVDVAIRAGGDHDASDQSKEPKDYEQASTAVIEIETALGTTVVSTDKQASISSSNGVVTSPSKDTVVQKTLAAVSTTATDSKVPAVAQYAASVSGVTPTQTTTTTTMQRRGRNKLVNVTAKDESKNTTDAAFTNTITTTAARPKLGPTTAKGGPTGALENEDTLPPPVISAGYAVAGDNVINHVAATTMKKLGRHKLVLKGPNTTSIMGGDRSDPRETTGPIAGTKTQDDNLGNKTAAGNEPTSQLANSASNKPHATKQTGLTRKGSNKLVLNSSRSSNSSSTQQQGGDAYFYNNGNKRNQIHPSQHYRRPISTIPSTHYHQHHHEDYGGHHQYHHRGAKRIKLGLSSSGSHYNGEGDDGDDEDDVATHADSAKDDQTMDQQESSQGVHNPNAKLPPPALVNDGKKGQEEKLTDFAYRETHKVRQRGGNKRWTKVTASQDLSSAAAGTSAANGSGSNTHAGRRSMGLVRVRSDIRKTPVCPTFLRGLSCTDKYCTKRHDVPKEFALPVCSFFQRHGQCLKENCQFRHVKVNIRATLCPSFALLGFCEDPECFMAHERPQRSSSHRPNNSNKGNNNVKSNNERGTKNYANHYKNNDKQSLPTRYWDNQDQKAG